MIFLLLATWGPQHLGAPLKVRWARQPAAGELVRPVLRLQTGPSAAGHLPPKGTSMMAQEGRRVASPAGTLAQRQGQAPLPPAGKQ